MRFLLLLLSLSLAPAALPEALTAGAMDLLPEPHGLRYEGREGRIPVTVEITLRERRAGVLEYVRWVTPTGWAAWFRDPEVTRARLRFEDERLVLVGHGEPDATPPPELAPGTLDSLGIRLRARADVARGMREAEYKVWKDGLTQTWTLQVIDRESVDTPDGRYDCLRVRLGTESEWIEAWSAPLLLFHFVRIEHWQDGRKVAEAALTAKEL
ncbi:MAG TPA: DUF3108 domain-containing protein [Gammaproteobacteria bacterium]|nr:DUF3108 domain-containing protein [Gammaproteobacteria bacterium]